MATKIYNNLFDSDISPYAILLRRLVVKSMFEQYGMTDVDLDKFINGGGISSPEILKLTHAHISRYFSICSLQINLWLSALNTKIRELRFIREVFGLSMPREIKGHILQNFNTESCNWNGDLNDDGFAINTLQRCADFYVLLQMVDAGLKHANHYLNNYCIADQENVIFYNSFDDINYIFTCPFTSEDLSKGFEQLTNSDFIKYSLDKSVADKVDDVSKYINLFAEERTLLINILTGFFSISSELNNFYIGKFCVFTKYNPWHGDDGRFISNPNPDSNDSKPEPGYKPMVESQLTDEQKSYYKDKLGCDDESIEFIRTAEEAEIYVQLGIKQLPEKIKGYAVFVGEIEVESLRNPKKQTNRNILIRGMSPITSNLDILVAHHIGQRNNSPIAYIPKSVHKTYDKILHPEQKDPSDINRYKFESDRKIILSRLLQILTGNKD